MVVKENLEDQKDLYIKEERVERVDKQENIKIKI